MILQVIYDNIVCVVLVTLGVMAWAITIGARISSKKQGRFVSGVPAVGGILVIIGFLCSKIKWLALIGLLDFDLWYLISEIFSLLRYTRDYVPPEEYDGGKVVMYSNYKNGFEEYRYPSEYPGSCEVHYVRRYIIISKEGKYTLLRLENDIRIINRVECDTVEACIAQASKKAKFKKRMEK